MSVTIVVNFRASEGNAAKLAALLQQGCDFSRKAEGSESFDLFQRQNDPNKFMFMQQWASLEAHKQHVADNVVESGHLDKIKAVLAAPPDNSVLEAV